MTAIHTQRAPARPVWAWVAPSIAANTEPARIVARHPAGGWTHAVKTGPATRIYEGWYPTAKAAARAL